MTKEEYDLEVSKIEKELGYTLEEAESCGCYMHPESCEKCWNLGWRIGGIGLNEKSKGDAS